MIDFKRNKIRILGQMSGTSCDGHDLVIIELDFAQTDYKYSVIKTGFYPFDFNLKTSLEHIIHTNEISFDEYSKLNIQYTENLIDNIQNFIAQEQVDLISIHGQTVYHLPPQINKRGVSTQLGILPFISKSLRIPVIGDYRNHDMANFGHGAPLVPFFDFHLFNQADKNQMVVNIGGISNATILPKNGDIHQIIAGDLGPGNILIDLAMKKLFNQNYDNNGETALTGKVDYDLVNHWLNNDSFIALPFPKSTGRELYNQTYLNTILYDCFKSKLQPQDIIATVTQFTAEILIMKAIELGIDEIILSGGGAKNQFLISQLKSESELKINVLNDILIDYKEAIIFALLGFNYCKNIPSTLNSTTGIKSQSVLGTLSLP